MTPLDRSESCPFFGQIGNRIPAKMRVLSYLRRTAIFEVVSGDQSDREGPQKRVYKAFCSIPVF